MILLPVWILCFLNQLKCILEFFHLIKKEKILLHLINFLLKWMNINLYSYQGFGTSPKNHGREGLEGSGNGLAGRSPGSCDFWLPFQQREGMYTMDLPVREDSEQSKQISAAEMLTYWFSVFLCLMSQAGWNISFVIIQTCFISRAHRNILILIPSVWTLAIRSFCVFVLPKWCFVQQIWHFLFLLLMSTLLYYHPLWLSLV